MPDIFEKNKNLLTIRKDRLIAPLVKRISPAVRPDFFSYGRLGLAALLFVWQFLDWPKLFIVLIVFYILSKLTDWLDGALARMRKMTSIHGYYLDILADKFFYLVGWICLATVWPQFLAWFIMIAVESLVLVLIVVDMFIFGVWGKFNWLVRMIRRILEGLGYLTAIFLLIWQLF